MLRAFVVRHAQSLANLDARLSSAEPGPELTSLGHDQARDVGAALAEEGVVRIYSSPLLRTLATAEHISARLGIEFQVLPDLREFGLGDWEGRNGTDQDITGHPVFSSWLTGARLAERFQGGESALEVRDRLSRALEQVEAQVSSGSVVLVTHGGLMAIAVPLLVDIGTATARIPANAETWELVRDHDGWRVASPGKLDPWTPGAS
jgi:broad specificity phosphatase PhoE